MISELSSLVARIVDHNHAAARRSMESIGTLVVKVRRVHGERHPELVTVARIFDEICADLGPHMRAEEGSLFPAILMLARPDLDARRREALRVSIVVMQHDHEALGRLLHRMREVTSDFALPEDACASYRTLYEELEAFERDLHEHIHMENDVLLPRALST